MGLRGDVSKSAERETSVWTDSMEHVLQPFRAWVGQVFLFALA